MQKKRKLFSLSALVCALLMVFAFAFAGCDDGSKDAGTGSEGGDWKENYTSVPTTDTGAAPATLSLDATTASVSYGGTLTLTAMVGNPVAGTVTWSVAEEGAASLTFAADDATDAITADSATATLTLTGAAVTSTAYNVTATFVAADNAENTASATCAVTVVASNVTVNVTGTASSLYTDGTEAEKSATLTATVTGTSGATIAWSKADENNLVTLTDNQDGTATVTLNSGVEDTFGSVTVTATVTYNDGVEEKTASKTFTMTVTGHSLKNIATITFDGDSAITEGTNVAFTTQFGSNITATYGGGNGAIQSTTAKSGNALKIENGQNKGAYFTLDFSGVGSALIGDGDTVSISYWSYIEDPIVISTNASDASDWSSIATVMNGDKTLSSLRYITLNSRVKTDASDPTNGNVWPSHADSAHAANWAALLVDSQWIYVTVEISATKINYYVGGVLQASYDTATTPAKEAVTAVIEDIRAVFNGTGTLKLFGNKEGSQGGDLYVDEVKITKNITAAELYAEANPAA